LKIVEEEEELEEEIIEIVSIEDLKNVIKEFEDYGLDWHVWIHSDNIEDERWLIEQPYITIDIDKTRKIVNIIIQFQDKQLEQIEDED